MPQAVHTHGCRKPEMSTVSGIALEIRQVMRAVSREVPLAIAHPPDEFFPAHLPVALIDAVYGSVPEGEEPPAPVAERYCRHFGLARARENRWQLPPIHDQETLRDLIEHYDDLGVGAMAARVFRVRGHFPGTGIARAEYVLRLAIDLRRVGVDVLQDLRTWRRRKMDLALRTLTGADEHIVRTLLNYAGDDDFVWGDASVRRFVAFAIGRETVSAPRAASLVRQAAYELIVSPRYLDHQIWRYSDRLPE